MTLYLHFRNVTSLIQFRSSSSLRSAEYIVFLLLTIICELIFNSFLSLAVSTLDVLEVDVELLTNDKVTCLQCNH